MVQLMPLSPHHLLLHQHPEWFNLLVPAYQGCPGKEVIKRVFVCQSHFTVSLQVGGVTKKKEHKTQIQQNKQRILIQHRVCFQTSLRHFFRQKISQDVDRFGLCLRRRCRGEQNFQQCNLSTIVETTTNSDLYNQYPSIPPNNVQAMTTV